MIAIRQPLFRLAAVACLALPFAACVSKKEHEKAVAAKQAEVDKLQQEAKLRDDYVGELTTTWNEVQDAVSRIETERESVQAMLSQGEKGPVSQARRDAVLARIADIEATLKQYKQKMANLSKKLAEEKSANARLRELVAKLETSIVAKENEIAGLRTELDGLKTTVAALEQAGVEKDKVIEEKTGEVAARQAELDKAFWIQAEAKELETKGIVRRTGGVLGMGKSLRLAGSIDETLFEKIEIPNKLEFALASPLDDVRLISSHPKESYELVKVDEKNTTLKVLDPAVFWKLGKFLVVEINH